MLGNVECVFALYDKMRGKWVDVCLLQGLLNIYSLLLCPPLLPLYHCTPAIARWRYTSRLGSSAFGDALGEQYRVNSEMHLDAGTERVWSSTWRWRSSEIRNALWCHDQVSLEMHLEAQMEWTQSGTWRPWSITFGGVLGGGWSGGDWSEGGQSGGSQYGGTESGCGRSGGMCNGSWDSIYSLILHCGNVESWAQYGPLRAERLAGSRRQLIFGWCGTLCRQYSVYTVLGICSTRCMLYLVYPVLGACCTSCMLYSVYAELGVCCPWCMLYPVLSLDHGMERLRVMT